MLPRLVKEVFTGVANTSRDLEYRTHTQSSSTDVPFQMHREPFVPLAGKLIARCDRRCVDGPDKMRVPRCVGCMLEKSLANKVSWKLTVSAGSQEEPCHIAKLDIRTNTFLNYSRSSLCKTRWA